MMVRFLNSRKVNWKVYNICQQMEYLARTLISPAESFLNFGSVILTSNLISYTCELQSALVRVLNVKVLPDQTLSIPIRLETFSIAK